MRRFVTGLGLAVLVTLTATADDEEKIPLDKVPKPVLDAVNKLFPDANLTGAESEKEKDKLVYEVSLTEKGRTKNTEVAVTPEGEVQAIERELDAGELPKAVTQALEGKYPKATIKSVESVTRMEKGKELPVSYEVALVTADKKALEVEIDAAGKIGQVEEDDGDDGEAK